MRAPHLRKGRARARHDHFVPVPRGLEPVLLAELEVLGLGGLRSVEGGAFFRGTLEDCYRANLWLRTGMRVLRVIHTFACTADRHLYRGVREVDWYGYLEPRDTLAVRARLGDTGFTHSHYVAQRIKDAVVDQLRETFGARPSVDTRDPTVQIHAWLDGGRCTLSLDSSGPPLFMRGYREQGGPAPLKENLAAGLIALTGWRGERPFADIMAGSGTLAIEAALLAGQRAPGLTRETWGFARWPDYQPALWRRLVAEARAAARPVPVPIHAGDRDAAALDFARTNAAAAGVADAIAFTEEDFRDFRPRTDPGVLLVNPPYGERLARRRELPALYKALGDVFKQHCKGWDAYVFTERGELAKSVGLRPSRRHVLFNGPIECRLLHYRIH